MKEVNKIERKIFSGKTASIRSFSLILALMLFTLLSVSSVMALGMGISRPLTGTNISTTIPLINATTSDNANCTYNVSDGSSPGELLTLTGNDTTEHLASNVDVSSLADGTLTIDVYCINASNASITANQSVSINKDTTKPTVAYITPGGSNVRMYSQFNFTVNVTSTIDIASVTIWNGTGYSNMDHIQGTLQDGYWSAILDLTNFGADGAKIITVNATNNVGMYNDTETLNILVDNTGPNIALEFPGNHANTTTNPEDFEFNASDALIEMMNTMNCTLLLYNSTGDIINSYNNASTANSTLTDTALAFPGAVEGTYTWNVTCYDRAGSNVITPAVGNAGSSATYTVTYDVSQPSFVEIGTSDPDDLVSGIFPNNNISLFVKFTDSISGVHYVLANFSDITGSQADIFNMTPGSNGYWYYNYTVSQADAADEDFELYNITTRAYDYAGNAFTGPAPAVAVLYNLSVPETMNPCVRFAAGTTNFSVVTDFTSVDFTVVVEWNHSTFCQYFGPNPNDQFYRVARINFSSLNLSDQATAQKLGQLENAIDVDISPDGTFGNSSIYINSTFFAELDTYATVALYDLPFDAEPGVSAAADAAGINGTIEYVTYTHDVFGVVGNLTFNVDGFSSYNAGDGDAPIITVVSPAPNQTYIQGPTPLVNVSVNGTGTQVSNITILVDAQLYYMSQMACVNETGSEKMDCWFTPTVSDGSRTLTINAWDFGAGTYPGNWNQIVWQFTSDSTPPAVVGNQSNVTGQVVGPNDHILFNVTVNDATNVSSVTVYNGANVVAMTNHTPTGYNLTTTPTAFGCTSSGTCTVTFNATDYWGQSNTTITTSFTVDAGPPSVTAASVTNATNVTSAVGVNIQATVADPGTVASVKANGQAMALLSGTTTSGTWSATLTAAQLNCVGEGTCTITLNATDNLGNYNDTETTSYVIDDTNPAVTNPSAVPGVVKTTGTLNIGVVVTDSSNVTSVTTNNSLALAKTSTGWNLTTTPGALGCPATGTCTIGFTATDMAGNSNSTETATVTVDNTAPTVTFTYNSTNLAKSTTAVILNVTAADTNSVATVKANNASMTQQGATNVWSINAAPATFNCGSSGSCVVTFTANDTAGNSDASTTTTITIDDNGPAVSGGSVTNATSAQRTTGVNVQVTVADTAGIAGVSVAGNTLYQLSGSNTSGVWSNNLTGVQLGCTTNSICTITFTAVDMLGNTNNTHTTSYIIDDLAPTNLTAFSASAGSTSATVSATMNESAKCTVNYGTNDTNLSSSADAATFAATMSVSLSGLTANTLYYYNITECWDAAGNSQNLNLGPFNFTTGAATTTTTGGGGGGGGLKVASYHVGELVGTASEWNLGRGDAVHFNHNADEHRMKALNIGSNYVVLQIMSEPQELTLYIGQSQEVDLDSDAKPDIAVRLIDIVYRKALISVTSLVTQKQKIELLPPAKPTRRTVEEEPAQEIQEEPIVEPTPVPAPQPEPQVEPEPVPMPAETADEGNMLAVGGIFLTAIAVAVILFVYIRRQKRKGS